MKIVPAVVSLFLLLVTASAAPAQTRPALVGNGPEAIVNLIDMQRIANKGMTEGMTMFACSIDTKGRAHNIITFRDSKGSRPLIEQVLRATEKARFIPALYQGQAVPVYFQGTAMVFTAEGRPRLRVFAHANPADLKGLKDFVAPQLILGTGNWEAAKLFLENYRGIPSSGTCEVEFSIDTAGKMNGMRVLAENPRGQGFAEAVKIEYQNARFIPGFRDGKMVPCTFTFTEVIKFVDQEFFRGMRGSLLPER